MFGGFVVLKIGVKLALIVKLRDYNVVISLNYTFIFTEITPKMFRYDWNQWSATEILKCFELLEYPKNQVSHFRARCRTLGCSKIERRHPP